MPHSYGRILSFPYFHGRRNRPSTSGRTGKAIAKTKKTITGRYAVPGPPTVCAVVVACNRSITLPEALVNYRERKNIKLRMRPMSMKSYKFGGRRLVGALESGDSSLAGRTSRDIESGDKSPHSKITCDTPLMSGVAVQ